MPVRFFDRRFVLVTGKGGVGRSSICAAIALEASRRGKRVLVCELNTKERIAPLLGAAPVGANIGPVDDGIWSVNIRPEDAMREYGLMKLRIRALYRAAFENRLVRSFLRLIPGLNELLLLGKAFYHAQETDPHTGRPSWDMVVVDAPATGHGVPFLRIPQVVLSVTQTGPMADDARRMQELITDPERTSLNIVTLPESLPVNEAVQLKRQVDDLLHIPTGFLFLNAVHGPPFREPSERAFQAVRVGYRGEDPLMTALIGAGTARMRRHELEHRHLSRARAAIDMPRVRIPYVYEPEWNRVAIQAVSRAVTEGIEHHEGEG